MRTTRDLVLVEEVGDGLEYHHIIYKVRKKPRKETRKLRQKNNYIWFLKGEVRRCGDEVSPQSAARQSIREDQADKEAVYETVAQETFRLFVPWQPKTRLVLDEKSDVRYVMSREVPGYRSLQGMDRRELKSGIKSGTITGLGEILVIALLLNEVDLKFSNLCLNEHNQLVKIDGDSCFARINTFKNKTYDITAHDIEQLPFIEDYFAYNWLDLMEYRINIFGEQTTKRKRPVFIDAEMKTHPGFRAEVNRALLKVALIPAEFYPGFIGNYTYTHVDVNELSRELIERSRQMREAAVRNPAFREFMQSNEAAQTLNDFLEYLRQFRTGGKNYLPMSECEELIRENYRNLRLETATEIKKRVRFRGAMFSEPPRVPVDENREAKKLKTT